MKQLILLIILFVLLTGCSSILEQLGRDPASVCGYETITYGAGAVIPSPAVPLAGIYQHARFCRSNTPGSVISLKPDGTIELQHGVKELEDDKNKYERPE